MRQAVSLRSSEIYTIPSVVLLKSGVSAGKIAVITEVIDHKRVRPSVLAGLYLIHSHS